MYTRCNIFEFITVTILRYSKSYKKNIELY